MIEFTIRRAVMSDVEVLTALTIASKAYWGYSKAFMRKAAPYLRVLPEHIETSHSVVMQVNGRIIGYYQLVPRDDRMIWLESLFVHPDMIGKGCGVRLLDHACALAKALGFSHMEFESDAHAENFYLKQGAIRIGGRESMLQRGLIVPKMRIVL